MSIICAQFTINPLITQSNAKLYEQGSESQSCSLASKYTTTWELQFSYLTHLNTLTVQHGASCEPLTGLLCVCVSMCVRVCVCVLV